MHAACSAGLWKGGGDVVIDGVIVNGSAKLVGWTVHHPLVPDRLHLQLRLYHDYRPFVLMTLWINRAQGREKLGITCPTTRASAICPISPVSGVLATGSDRNAPLARMLSLVGAIAGLRRHHPLWTGFDNEDRHAVRRARRRGFRASTSTTSSASMAFRCSSCCSTPSSPSRRPAGWQVIEQKVVPQYNAAFPHHVGPDERDLLALDGILFYVFFEASLIPMYIIIGVWGGPNRVYAASSSSSTRWLGCCCSWLPMYLFLQSGGSFDPRMAQAAHRPAPRRLSSPSSSPSPSRCRCGRSIPGCRTPTSRPTGGSVVLAAIALKLGAYGFIRFRCRSAGCQPTSAGHHRPVADAVVYIGFVAWCRAT